MLKLAVTGGLASGKSTVCRFFEERGAYVISADTIVHRLISPQTATGQKIIALLGPEIVEGSEINRRLIAARVFDDSETLAKLEAILHPAVAIVMEEEYEKALVKGAPLFVAEVPLLFESGQEKHFDRVLVVTAPYAMREMRYNKEDFSKRIARQTSDEERCRKADYVIENQGNMTLLENQVNHIFSTLTKG